MLKLNGAETNPQELLSLDNQEDGPPAWVTLAVPWPAVALLSALFLSVPENVTENPASSPKSLNSLTGSSPRWEVALAAVVALEVVLEVALVAALAAALALALLPVRLLVLSLPTSPTAANTINASVVDKESWALVVLDFASTSASECATGLKLFNAK